MPKSSALDRSSTPFFVPVPNRLLRQNIQQQKGASPRLMMMVIASAAKRILKNFYQSVRYRTKKF